MNETYLGLSFLSCKMGIILPNSQRLLLGNNVMRDSKPSYHAGQYGKLPTQTPFLLPTFLHGPFHLLTHLVLLLFLLSVSPHKTASSEETGIFVYVSAQRSAQCLTHNSHSIRYVE